MQSGGGVIEEEGKEGKEGKMREKKKTKKRRSESGGFAQDAAWSPRREPW